MYRALLISTMCFIAAQGCSNEGSPLPPDHSEPVSKAKVTFNAEVANARKPAYDIVELERPNSGEYSFDEARRAWNKGINIATTDHIEDWGPPYLVRLAIHIDQNDKIRVYDSFPLNDDSLDIPGLRNHIDIRSKMLLGNPMAVLLTTEISPQSSETFQGVLDELFKPSIQVFYPKSSSGD